MVVHDDEGLETAGNAVPVQKGVDDDVTLDLGERRLSFGDSPGDEVQDSRGVDSVVRKAAPVEAFHAHDRRKSRARRQAKTLD
jgi:hypothetical protein